MQGSLKQIPLPEVLQFISMGKNSGLLHLRRGNSEIHLYIRGGRIVNSSSIERQRRLGDHLVNRGLIKRSELSQLLQIQKTVESDKRLGQILVERQIVTEETIREAIRIQLEEEIWGLFSWEDGEFLLEQVDEDQIGDAIVSIEIEPLILEGSRRTDEWRKIRSVIPNEGVVLKLNPIHENFARKDLQLTSRDWRVLSQINGHFTVRAIINRSNLGRFEVHRILFRFVEMDLVHVVHGQSAESVGKLSSMAVKTAAEDSKGKGGLFGLLGGRKTEAKPSQTGLAFISPIGLTAHVANTLALRMMATREYVKGDQDDRLLEMLWHEVVQSYTRADLITAIGNRLDVAELELYLGNCEFSETIDDCFEDALEGLLALLQRQYRIFAQRAGERTASRVMRELLDEIGAKAELTYRSTFQLADRLQKALKLAA